MKLSVRNYQGEADYQSVGAFLREVFLRNQRHMYSWPVARLDYWRWHGIMNLGDGSLEEHVFIWETDDREIVAVLNSEGLRQAFLQIHPRYKSMALEEQMIQLAEENFRGPSQRGGSVLWVWSDAGDTSRQELLKRLGFNHISEADEHQWLRNLEEPIIDRPVKQGYEVRPLGGDFELPSRSWASWRAFHPNEPDDKYQNDWTWYQNIQKAPLYRPELDLVAIAPDDEVAAFTTIWYDEATKSGYFEPVGTRPEHQRQGLARSIMTEGLRRLKRCGATQAMVIGGSMRANALYASVLGPVYDNFQPWERRWAEG
jgi:mycothiol synthase